MTFISSLLFYIITLQLRSLTTFISHLGLFFTPY